MLDALGLPRPNCAALWTVLGLTHFCQRLASNRCLLIYIYRASIIILQSDPHAYRRFETALDEPNRLVVACRSEVRL